MVAELGAMRPTWNWLMMHLVDPDHSLENIVLYYSMAPTEKVENPNRDQGDDREVLTPLGAVLPANRSCMENLDWDHDTFHGTGKGFTPFFPHVLFSIWIGLP